jgi:hypothetical protein
MSCTEKDEARLVAHQGPYWDGCADWGWEKDEEIKEALLSISNRERFIKIYCSDELPVGKNNSAMATTLRKISGVIDEYDDLSDECLTKIAERVDDEIDPAQEQTDIAIKKFEEIVKDVFDHEPEWCSWAL